MNIFREEFEDRAIELRVYRSEGGYSASVYVKALQVSHAFRIKRSDAIRAACNGLCDRLADDESNQIDFKNLFVAMLAPYFERK